MCTPQLVELLSQWLAHRELPPHTVNFQRQQHCCSAPHLKLSSLSQAVCLTVMTPSSVRVDMVIMYGSLLLLLSAPPAAAAPACVCGGVGGGAASKCQARLRLSCTPEGV